MTTENSESKTRGKLIDKCAILDENERRKRAKRKEKCKK